MTPKKPAKKEAVPMLKSTQPAPLHSHPTAQPPPPTIGYLTTIGVPDLLRRAYSERFTGELLLSRGDEQKQIYFETGNIVFAASNQPTDRIGMTLLRQGLITQADFDRILAQAREGKRFGQALVEAGLMSERDLITNITFQVLDIIYSVFNWTTGMFEFIPGEQRVAEELKLKLTTANIILEGVRRIEDFAIIRRGLGDLNRLIAPSSSPLLRVQTMTLKPAERQLLELITQPLDLLHILVAASTPPLVTLKAIFGLISAGVLEQTDPPTLSHDTGKFEVPAAPRFTLPLAASAMASQAQFSYSPDYAALRSHLDALWTRIRTNNPYLILNVPAGASLENINLAYLQLANQFHPDRFLTAPVPLRREIEDAFRHVVQSFEYLRHQALHAQRFPVSTSPTATTNTSATPPPSSPTRVPNPVKPTGNPEVDAAIDDFLAYLDGQKPPLVVSDALSMLLRTEPPFALPRERVAEIVAGWAYNQASARNRPLNEMLLTALQNIHHAEQARVLKAFNSETFYEAFIADLMPFCSQEEQKLFKIKLGSLREFLRHG